MSCSTWSGRGVTFEATKKRSKGIHKTIKCLFAPSYDYKKLTKIPKNKGGLSFQKAKRKGKLIDSQISGFFAGTNTKPCKEVLLLLFELSLKNLEIIGTQVTVADETSRLATPIDLVVIDKETLKITVVEIKYGCNYRHCFTIDGALKYQKTNLNDCLFHQHQLQILIGKWMYQKETKQEVNALLIYINGNDSIDFFTEDKFEAELNQEGINALFSSANLTNKQLFGARKRQEKIAKNNKMNKRQKTNFHSIIQIT